MNRRPTANLKNRNSRRFTTALPKAIQKSVVVAKRSRGRIGEDRGPFNPPEDWHEPHDASTDSFEVVVQSPGHGYQHVVAEADIRQRLSKLPAKFTAQLQVVQLSRMTRKKRSFPCYGMQWGTAIYLYPVEAELIEYFVRPPRPAEYNETRLFGGKWEQEGVSLWKLRWTPAAIRDFYLNNVLIHELGHLLDKRNTSYQDRERYAEWFAIEYGYRGRGKVVRTTGSRRRRHRSK
ncbi:MAG TPA: hypothetical protein VMM76_26585 [Pirellulaceae bacterium]|nr:hypothetical protein [Pirellulaceae bacterium]